MSQEKAGNKSIKEEVLREYAPVGKYRIRLLQNPKTGKRALDIREYVSTGTFEGFTRRGVRIQEVAQADLLKEILAEVLDAGALVPKPTTGS